MPRDSIRARVAMASFGHLADETIKGRTIKKIGWVHPDDLGIQHYAICLVLDDGTEIVVMSDDEGNDAGALGIAPGNPSVEAFTLPRI